MTNHALFSPLPLFRLRESIVSLAVKWTGPIYCKLRVFLHTFLNWFTQSQRFSTQPWKQTKLDLSFYQEGSLGKSMFYFLDKENYDLMPWAETHDACHVILGYGTTVKEEICLQFCLLGSGKRSIYLLGTLVLGFGLFPEYWNDCIQAFQRGQSLVHFSKWSFEHLLNEPLDVLRQMILQTPPSNPFPKDNLNTLIF